MYALCIYDPLIVMQTNYNIQNSILAQMVDRFRLTKFITQIATIFDYY